ncbi:MAG: AI-2E family transporter [Methylococcaceae bacterium]|nr:AI-2E family transporter [Methylococcaceae bacterium]
MATQPEVRSRLVGGFCLLALGAWILHSFLGLLIWAVVLALTTWPVYRWLQEGFRPSNAWSAVILTLLIGAIILLPLGYGLSKLIAEAQSLGQLLQEAQSSGLPAPDWLQTVPMAGNWARGQWDSALGTPDAAKDTLHSLGTGSALAYTKALASQILHRMAGFFITLLALFFLYRSGETLGRQILDSSRKLFGETGIRYTEHAVTAVRATVNGLVLVGLGEGLLLGVGYAVAGLSHPAMLGAITGVLAMVPFAAKPVFAGCALVLMAQGHVAAGVGLFVFGLAVLLVADNYVRPLLIGGSVKLPFLWTLLGIFGGVENFGLLGLFLGPTVMAVLISIWRDWLEEAARPG